jgi:putative tryptophan/tyrosine transport system substrate-binding protein
MQAFASGRTRLKRREFTTLLGCAAASWLLAARAQQTAMPMIGFLTSTKAAAIPHFIAAFHDGLADAGFVEGKNVVIEYRFAEQRLERLPALTMDLVRKQVAVIFTSGGDVPALGQRGNLDDTDRVFDRLRSGQVGLGGKPQSPRRQCHGGDGDRWRARS